MKKLLFCLLLLGLCVEGFALEAHVGVRVGATLSQLAGEDWDVNKDEWEWLLESSDPGLYVSHSDYWGLGFTAGFLVEVSLFRFLALQPEVLYTTYHGGVKLQNDDWSSDWMKIGTIYRLAEACLLVKFRLGQRLAVFSGPLLMYRFLPPKVYVGIQGDSESEPMTDDSFYKDLAYGIVGGVELRAKNGAFIEVRYNYNLTSLDNYGYPYLDDTIFRGVIASVGLYFGPHHRSRLR
jgi:hypothetical protein